VVCVVDAVNMEDLFDKQPEVRLQLALADLVLLNKTDCVQPDYLVRLAELIKGVNPMAKIANTTFCAVNEIAVLDTNSFSGEVVEKSTLLFCGINLQEIKQAGQKSFVHNPISQESTHKHDISSVGFTFEGSFEVNKFGLWMQNYLYFNRETIFRVKGIMSFDQTEDQFVFHAVRSSFMFEVGKPWGNDARFSKLVFIGKNISSRELESNLLQLLV
jgi:G3E family GTPase